MEQEPMSVKINIHQQDARITCWRSACTWSDRSCRHSDLFQVVNSRSICCNAAPIAAVNEIGLSPHRMTCIKTSENAIGLGFNRE